MRLLNIAVIEDDSVHAVNTVRLLEEWLDGRNRKSNISVFSNAESFLFEWERNKIWDVLFIDIQMPGINGIELAKSIRRENKKAAIVFVTGITDYMQEGYEVEALHYLVKPVDSDKIGYCMERVAETFDSEKKKRAVLIEAEDITGGKEGERIMLRLSPEDIFYMEAFKHNTEIYMEEKIYRIREGIGELRKRFEDDMFVPCHRSYLVNLMYISGIGKDALILDDGRKVPMSKRCAGAVKEAFIKFYSRMRDDSE